MTVRQVYEGTLVEINKVLAPSLLLEDFNYLFNKAIYQYINKRYNIYDINLQTTDDIRVLKTTAILDTRPSTLYKRDGVANLLYDNIWEVDLPSDYLHILNCVCNFKVIKRFKCHDAGTYLQSAAIRLTADIWPLIVNNFYMRPTYKRPYFYIHNVDSTSIPETNAKVIRIGKDIKETLKAPIRMEIRYGENNPSITLTSVYVDYIRTPRQVRLTLELLDIISDTSDIMEFPDYVCLEIINELVTLVMENASDPRLQTHIPVTQSIANPAQQLEKSK